jgi:hypothetical protein
MKHLIPAAVAVFAFVTPNYTPRPNVHQIGCVAYQVCQTCYGNDAMGRPTQWQCNCHMECLPGIH